jgi:hypothetical protein
MQFYEIEDRLVTVSGDKAAVWLTDAKQWRTLGAHMANKAAFEGSALTEAEAKAMFPAADLDSVPDLGDGGSEADADPELIAQLDEIEAVLDAED